MFKSIKYKEKLPIQRGDTFEWSLYCQRESDNLSFEFWFVKREEKEWQIVYYEALKKVDGAYRTLNIRLSPTEKVEIESYFLYDCKTTRMRFRTFG